MLPPGDPRTGDHINHDSLNNSRKNLRVADRSQQQHNKRRPRNNTTGFKGVYKASWGYVAQLQYRGNNMYLGSRKTAEEAAELYAVAAEKYHGEFAETDRPKRRLTQ